MGDWVVRGLACWVVRFGPRNLGFCFLVIDFAFLFAVCCIYWPILRHLRPLLAWSFYRPVCKRDSSTLAFI